MMTELGKMLEYCRHVALIHLSDADNQGSEVQILTWKLLDLSQ